MKIKKIIQRIQMMLILVCMMLGVSGCGQNTVDIQTELTLKEDGSGSRRMELTMNKQVFETVFEGSAKSLNEKIQENRPSGVEWTPSDDGEQYIFTCILYFDSLEDYRTKAKAMTGRDVIIEMEQPESVFASGVRYEEDFSSVELLSWLEILLKEEGYLKEGQMTDLFKESSIKVLWKDTDYELESSPVKIDNLVKTPVERIDILTHYMQNKKCSRQVVFTFSKDSMEKNGDAIQSYLKKYTPKNAQLSWTEKNAESLCTISAENLTSKELNSFMNKIFGESNSFVSAQTQQRAGTFDAASEWSELLDVTAFSYNKEKVAVGYYIQWDDGMDLTVRRQNSDTAFKLEDSERYGGYQTVIEKEMLSESLVTGISTTYVIEEIEVDMEFQKENYLSRKIALIFQVEPDEEDQETIRKTIARSAEGIAEVTVDEQRSDERFSIVLLQNGSINELNKGFLAVFNVQGQLSHEAKGDLLEFKHAGNFVDLMDFTNFIGNDPVLTTLTYRLTLPAGEQILEDSVSSNVKLKQGMQEIKGNQYSCTVEGAYLSMTLSTEVWNMDSIMLFLMILGGVVLVLLAALLAMKLRDGMEHVWSRSKHSDKQKDLDDDLDDFDDFDEPDASDASNGGKRKISDAMKKTRKKEAGDANAKEKKGIFSKKAPFVVYEETKFTDFDEEEWDPDSMVEQVKEVSLKSRKKENRRKRR